MSYQAINSIVKLNTESCEQQILSKQQHRLTAHTHGDTLSKRVSI